MATRSPERRQHIDRRRRADNAADLYQRLEEKRKQIERRNTVRREADRSGEAKTTHRRKAVPEAEQQASEPAVAGDLGNGDK